MYERYNNQKIRVLRFRKELYNTPIKVLYFLWMIQFLQSFVSTECKTSGYFGLRNGESRHQNEGQ